MRNLPDRQNRNNPLVDQRTGKVIDFIHPPDLPPRKPRLFDWGDLGWALGITGWLAFFLLLLLG